jgi:prophage regulatory protein
MKILNSKQVRELTLYSPQHRDRLERAGKFPKRVRLGEHRVGWVESEVLAWLQKRVESRSQ